MTAWRCCPPTAPPSAAYYKRHLRAGTPPCFQSLKDSTAYRKAAKAAAYSAAMARKRAES